MHYYAKFFVTLSDCVYFTLGDMFSNTIFTLPVVPFLSTVSFLVGPFLHLKLRIILMYNTHWTLLLTRDLGCSGLLTQRVVVIPYRRSRATYLSLLQGSLKMGCCEPSISTLKTGLMGFPKRQ
jgi:hypothetical protein